MDMINCNICNREILVQEIGEPFLRFKGKVFCQDCYIGLIKPIYEKSGMGDGGIIHLIFQECLNSPHNRKNRKQILNYKKQYNKLLHKYKFKCVYCGSDKKLTIDHKKPVSRGGTDDLKNLHVACKECNSKKGTKTHEEYLWIICHG